METKGDTYPKETNQERPNLYKVVGRRPYLLTRTISRKEEKVKEALTKSTESEKQPTQ